jgi:preprotein translocase subunit SecG
MQNVLLVIHLMIAIALVGAVLLQKSEGGGLGIGGGGGMGGLMSGRGSANLLTRTTAILAAVFFVTSMALAWLVSDSREPASIMDTGPASAPAEQPAGEVPAGEVPATEPSAPSGASDEVPSVPLATESSPAPAATAPVETTTPPAPAVEGTAGSTEPAAPLGQ